MMHSTLLPRAFQRVGIHYGWAVVAVVFLTMLSTSAAMGMVGVLMLPLKTEFGWDLGAIPERWPFASCFTEWWRRSRPPSCCDTGCGPSSELHWR